MKKKEREMIVKLWDAMGDVPDRYRRPTLDQLAAENEVLRLANHHARQALMHILRMGDGFDSQHVAAEAKDEIEDIKHVWSTLPAE